MYLVPLSALPPSDGRLQFGHLTAKVNHLSSQVTSALAGGIATPADAALVMQLGAEAVFVGSGIFKSDDPEQRARAIVKAATYYNDPVKLLEASADLGIGMPGLDIAKLAEGELLQTRGW